MDSSLENKKAQTLEDLFENLLINSKRKPNLIESDRGNDFHNKTFQNFLKRNNKKNFLQNTSSRDVLQERFNRTVRDLLKRPVFERGDGSWFDILSTMKKQNNNRVHSSTKLTTIEASLKKRRI